MQEPVLVWGGGAIGGTMAAWWARAGVPVLMVDVQQDHVEACRTRGLRIEGPVDEFVQVVQAVTPGELKALPHRQYRQVVLAVKALATEAALQDLIPYLADDGAVLSAQNGLNEVVIARTIGAQRTLGCFVNFAADWVEPGRILFGSRGTVALGELDGQVRPRTQRMHELLQCFEPDAILSTNIWGHLWGKLGYLSMVYATALTNESMLANFEDASRRDVFIGLARETMAVARAREVRPIGFSGFDPLAFAQESPRTAAQASLAALCEFRRKSAKTHSGIWRDLAVRKRRTEVDSQIGLIVEMGEEAGIPTPMLRNLTRLIHEVEEGRRVQSPETFQALAETCRQATTSTAA
ncbi:MAG TPA: 2-dehydropantoate 2-reductase N-terminal domain-containing protein [Ramlibacter sp.]|nr:2-dehydropantoate 2-reductase N-terminal domain-containing protein [Ramlibacter sp.]